MKPGARVHEACSAVLTVCNALPQRMRAQTLEVRSLRTDPGEQGRGYATELMHRVCREADEAGITLILWAKPFGNEALSASALIDWYRREFGFVALPGPNRMMARPPWNTPKRLTDVARAADEALQ